MEHVLYDNSLWAWGSNFVNQIGNGNTEYQPHPVKIMSDVVSVAAGDNSTMAITTDGTLWGWGHNRYGTLGDVAVRYVERPIRLLDDVVDVSLHFTHALALRSDGSLWGWGLASALGIGVGFPEQSGATGADLLDYMIFEPIELMRDVISFDAGAAFSMVITSDNTLWAWGINTRGQVGAEPFPNARYPVRVMDDVVAVAAGGLHAIALTSSGSVYSWGGNMWMGGNPTARVANSSPYDQPTPTWVMDDVVQIFVGGFDAHAVFAAVQSDGTIWGWGDNWFNQISQESVLYHAEPVPLHGLIMVFD